MSRNAISSFHGGRRTLPYAFTEHGAVMAVNVLRSGKAIEMSVFVVRVFVLMRQFLGGRKELAVKLAALERRLSSRLDTHETAIVDVLRQITLLLNPPATAEPEDDDKKKIGFTAKEAEAGYA